VHGSQPATSAIGAHRGLAQRPFATLRFARESHTPTSSERVAVGSRCLRPAIALRKAVFNNELDWRNTYTRVKCVGEEKVDDKLCYKVEANTPDCQGDMTGAQ
jgi:hypothetical protein